MFKLAGIIIKIESPSKEWDSGCGNYHEKNAPPQYAAIQQYCHLAQKMTLCEIPLPASSPFLANFFPLLSYFAAFVCLQKELLFTDYDVLCTQGFGLAI